MTKINWGYLEIQANYVPDSIQEILPQMGDVLGGEYQNEPIKGIQGILMDHPLTEEEIAILDTAKASGEIGGYSYEPPKQ